MPHISEAVNTKLSFFHFGVLALATKQLGWVLENVRRARYFQTQTSQAPGLDYMQLQLGQQNYT